MSKIYTTHCVIYVRIQVFFGPYFPVFCPYTGKYGSEKTCILAYFMEWSSNTVKYYSQRLKSRHCNSFTEYFPRPTQIVLYHNAQFSHCTQWTFPLLLFFPPHRLELHMLLPHHHHFHHEICLCYYCFQKTCNNWKTVMFCSFFSRWSFCKFGIISLCVLCFLWRLRKLNC